jgi:hypothetical protein
MISKQRTIALSVLAIAAVLVLFAAAPLVTTHQAHAFWGRGWGWGGGWGGCGCGGWGGPWGGWGGWGW